MIWELVLTVMLNGNPREIDWKTVDSEVTCKAGAEWLNAQPGFYEYKGAKAFCAR